MDNKKFLSEFIEMYKSLPSLRQVKSKDYCNRIKKNNDYATLIEKLKEVDPDATKDTVIKKISSLRAQYRRESKKKRDSLKSGAGAEDEYVPTLWCYDLLCFLKDQDEPLAGVTTMQDENTNTFEEFTVRPSKRKVSEEDTLIKIACERLANSREPTEGDSLAQSWASQYSEMEAFQKTIARKIISDVLFQGCLGALEFRHAIQIQNVFNPSQILTPNVIPQYPMRTSTQLNYAVPQHMQNYTIRVPTPLSSGSSINSSRMSPQVTQNVRIVEDTSSINSSSVENLQNFFASFETDE
ncbi:uncharacterized protein [Eurosta solidaginis]|uniref:uncharacterized protein n=1 Tax=Eurosta solidaginis TaxID=178769 RepID=UPI003530CBFF